MGIDVGQGVTIAEDELRFTASRSGGPGGQNVNKVATKITLRFDLRASRTLTSEQKRRVAERLAARINREGVLTLHASRRRTQAANRADAVARFAVLLRDALRPPKRREPTRPTRGSGERRLEEKRLRSGLKLARARRPDSDD